MWPKILKYLALDVLAAAAALCVFSYFHHVRMLWNLGGGHGSEVVDVVQKPPQTELPETEQPETEQVVAPEPDYGQFGERFAEQFAASEDEYISTPDEYKSRDVHVTLTRSTRDVEGRPIKYYIYDIIRAQYRKPFLLLFHDGAQSYLPTGLRTCHCGWRPSAATTAATPTPPM